MATRNPITLRLDEIGDLAERLAIYADRIALAPVEADKMNVYGGDIVADLGIAARLLQYLWQSGLIYFPITLD